MNPASAQALKDRHRAIRETQPEDLRVRIHRAISWLGRAERENEDPDAQFLFLWIAFNAAYASEFGYEHAEREQTRQFVARLMAIDPQRRLHDTLHRQFSGSIRTLIENKFVFEPFWKAMREHDPSERWTEQFAASKRVALRALMEQQTDVVLGVVLDRLYTLRNQLIHGGATWHSAANRQQVRDGAHILSVLLPTVIMLMIESKDHDFGQIAYPQIGQ